MVCFIDDFVFIEVVVSWDFRDSIVFKTSLSNDVVKSSWVVTVTWSLTLRRVHSRTVRCGWCSSSYREINKLMELFSIFVTLLSPVSAANISSCKPLVPSNFLEALYHG